LAVVRRSKIGFAFQQFNLLARTLSLDNAALPLVYGGSNMKKRALDVLDSAGRAQRAYHTPNQLSGGEHQRIAKPVIW
jgi:putative ABC transport system ATP-binding protein